MKPGSLPQANTQPVPHMELFRFDTLIVEDDTPVGQNAIDIRENQLNLCCCLICFHLRDLPVKGLFVLQSNHIGDIHQPLGLTVPIDHGQFAYFLIC